MTCSRALRSVASGFVLCGLLAGCNNGSGSGTPITRLFFNNNNFGECDRLDVHLNLLAAQAVLAQLDDGSPDCALNATLESNGCDATFSEADDGSSLEVSIEGCDIPIVTSLFDCGFKEVDAQVLDGRISAQCSCAAEPICHYNSPCQQLPPICVNTDANPCEDCSNGLDDDGDGKIDCGDPICGADCGVGQTTMTCPTSSSTTTTTTTTISDTTTTTTTSSTIPVEATLVVFRLEAASAPVGALQWSVDYGLASGEFLGSGAEVQCVTVAAGALFAPNDIDAERDLRLGLIALSPIAAPVDVAHCNFAATAQPVPGDFTVTIDDATDADGNPVVATVSVLIPTP